MSEIPTILSLADRIKLSPIHQATDVERYMDLAELPKGRARTTLDELLVSRGQHPWNSGGVDAKAFREDASRIMDKHNLKPHYERLIFILYGQLTKEWMRHERK